MQTMQRHAKAVCIEDHPFVTNWIEERLRERGDEVVAKASSADDLVDLIDEHGANVCIMDVNIPGTDPFTATEVVRRIRPHIHIVFLSASVSPHHIEAALESGATGYFSKSDEPSEIVAGVRMVANGKLAFGRQIMNGCPRLREVHGKPATSNANVASRIDSKLEGLTIREKEVLRLIGNGMQRSAIARELHRSPKTIDKHRAAVMRKLDIHDRAELVLFAIREGVVAPQ